MEKKLEQTEDLTKDLTLEEAFHKLEETLGSLEQKDITLEESFQAYARGMQLLKYCSEQIDTVEKKIQLITADGNMQDFS